MQTYKRNKTRRLMLSKFIDWINPWIEEKKYYQKVSNSVTCLEFPGHFRSITPRGTEERKNINNIINQILSSSRLK